LSQQLAFNVPVHADAAQVVKGDPIAIVTKND
jgi:hypothetical protein